MSHQKDIAFFKKQKLSTDVEVESDYESIWILTTALRQF